MGVHQEHIVHHAISANQKRTKNNSSNKDKQNKQFLPLLILLMITSKMIRSGWLTKHKAMQALKFYKLKKKLTWWVSFGGAFLDLISLGFRQSNLHFGLTRPKVWGFTLRSLPPLPHFSTSRCTLDRSFSQVFTLFRSQRKELFGWRCYSCCSVRVLCTAVAEQKMQQKWAKREGESRYALSQCGPFSHQASANSCGSGFSVFPVAPPGEGLIKWEQLGTP